MNTVILKSGKEHSVLRRHPWIFSGAVGKIEGNPANGETVRILDSKKNRLGLGAWSGVSSIAVRIWSFDPDETIDAAFFRRKITAAYELRKTIFNGSLPEAFRLVYAESDGLPGVIADLYRDYAVIQLSTAGADRCRNEIAEALVPYAPGGIYERSDVDGRKREGVNSDHRQQGTVEWLSDCSLFLFLLLFLFTESQWPAPRAPPVPPAWAAPGSARRPGSAR